MSEVDKTLWVGNLPEVTEDLLYELFLQAGPLDSVKIAKERDGRQKSFAFVQFSHVESVPYTIKLMEGTQLFGRNLKLQTRPGSVHQQQQQQQQQQQGGQGQFRNSMNPYQNNQPQNVQNPYMNMQMTVVPQNPYMMGQPVINQSTGGTPPNFQRSHTWHGSDLSSSSGERDTRDRDDDRRRDNRTRDRSRGGDDRGRDNYRGSNDYNDRHSNNESMESRRQRVLHKQDQVLQTYRRDRDNRHGGGGGSPYQQRRGRYKTTKLETDAKTLARKQKDIDFGKSTVGYDKYVTLIPKHQRVKGVHPMTPNISHKTSRRSWDAQVKQWRIALHQWDAPTGEKQECLIGIDVLDTEGEEKSSVCLLDNVGNINEHESVSDVGNINEHESVSDNVGNINEHESVVGRNKSDADSEPCSQAAEFSSQASVSSGISVTPDLKSDNFKYPSINSVNQNSENEIDDGFCSDEFCVIDSWENEDT